jgi:hypothetical protein
VSGSHGTGKSTLIAAFLAERPEYAHEPEAFETLGDDIELTPSGEPTPEGLRALLEYTVSAVEGHARAGSVVFERSPVDYLAYAAAGRDAARAEREAFLALQVPIVRASLAHLDLIAYLPLPLAGPARRSGGGAGFRNRVDRCLRRALLDDGYDLFGDGHRPAVVELPPLPEPQLAALLRFTAPL